MNKLTLISGAVMCVMMGGALASDKVPCTKDEYNVASGLAKNNGYVWKGSQKTCRKEYGFNGIHIMPTNNLAEGRIYLVIKENPLRFQMKNEWSSPLFCAMMVNGKIANVGHECPR